MVWRTSGYLVLNLEYQPERRLIRHESRRGQGVPTIVAAPGAGYHCSRKHRNDLSRRRHRRRPTAPSGRCAWSRPGPGDRRARQERRSGRRRWCGSRFEGAPHLPAPRPSAARRPEPARRRLDRPVSGRRRLGRRPPGGRTGRTGRRPSRLRDRLGTAPQRPAGHAQIPRHLVICLLQALAVLVQSLTLGLHPGRAVVELGHDLAALGVGRPQRSPRPAPWPRPPVGPWPRPPRSGGSGPPPPWPRRPPGSPADRR